MADKDTQRHMSHCRAMMKTIGKLNDQLRKCNKEFQIRCYSKMSVVPIIGMQCAAQDCHAQIDFDKYFTVLAYHVPSKIYAAYITFSIFLDTDPRVVKIEYSCTDPEFRRHSLSLILRLIPFGVAIDMGCKYVVSEANEFSAGLMVTKFGCREIDWERQEPDEMFRWFDETTEAANVYCDLEENADNLQEQWDRVMNCEIPR